MLKVIYFGNDFYAENKTSSHHIAERLARKCKLLYVECPGLRSPKGNVRDIKKILSKIWKSFRGPKKVSHNFYIYTLFQLPYHKFTLVRMLNQWIILASVNILKIILRFQNPILWFVIPHVAMVPSRISNLCSVYYCIDDYAGIPDVDVATIEAMDDKMTSDCDIVFIASMTLLEKKMALNPNVYISPHGVDFDHFNSANYVPDELVPQELRNISPPIIGYFGLVDERIDIDLVKFLAQSRPSWNFVFIGRVDLDQNPCVGMKNVHFLGSKPYGLLPLYASRFAVGLMPYKVNHRMNINCNPLKLREYLSIGVPIVSAHLPQVMLFKDVVQIVDTDQDYLNNIDYLLKEGDSTVERKKRQESVRAFTWDARFLDVFSIVFNFIEHKCKRGNL